MRVISGTHGGRRLRSVEGRAVRPTSDRLRETLFNILTPVVSGARFLDVCAGSGAVGIEALSRGASHSTFIDRSRRACSIIAQNLESLGLEEEATILNRNAVNALDRLEEEAAVFDLVFIDPPYESEIYSAVMRTLGRGAVLSGEAIVVVEHRLKLPPEPDFGRLRAYREVKQGESALAFYARL
jgi:16S rRNA (guanine966-N2)-methyltransferase